MTEQLTAQLPVQTREHIPVTWAPVPRVNLLPIEIVEGRRFRRNQVFLGIAVVATIAVAAAGMLLAQRSVTSANDQLTASQAKVLVLQTEQARFAAVPKVIALVDAATAARTQALGTDVLWYRYLNDLNGALPAGVRLTAITLTMNAVTATSTGTAATSAPAAASTNPLSQPGAGTITLAGTADHYADVSSWLEALDKITGFSSSSLTSATKGDTGIIFSSGAVITSDALSGRYDKKAG
jgi:Tfp pilus assembly protein PilN